MTQSSKPEAERLAEATELVRLHLAGGPKAPAAFQSLLQELLSMTVLGKGPSLCLHNNGRDRHIISGPRRENPTSASKIFCPLTLTDGRFLYVFYDLFIDNDDQRAPYLKTVSSKMTYQRDFEGAEQIFRFEYVRKAPDHYPAAHVHIYGDWRVDGLPKALPKVHIPILRNTIEAVIRFLVNEFEVPTNEPPEVWKPVLDATEKEFLEVARTQRTSDSAPH